MDESRWEPRNARGGHYTITWKSREGKSRSVEARGIDISSSGLGLECSCELKAGSIVLVQPREGLPARDCEVIHCTPFGDRFRVGLEFREEARGDDGPRAPEAAQQGEPDYYEILQISRKADLQTINRVFRIMAVRFHPDNPETGDIEQFLRMQQAYNVLSDPERRREYDERVRDSEAAPRPIFALKDFVVGIEAEANRRLGMLALLYRQRQTVPDHPGVSLLDLEKEMGFPREYLTFTTWYLLAKEFVTVGDNSDYTITAAGADYVERKAVRNDIVGKLLNQDAVRVRFSGKGPRPKRGTRTVGRLLLPGTTLPGD